MIDPEKVTDEEVLKQIQREREEEVRAVRSGQQPQGAARTTPKGVGSQQEDVTASPLESPYGATYKPLNVPYADQVEELKRSRFKGKRTRF